MVRLMFRLHYEIGEFFGLNVFSGGFFSKPSTKIPLLEKREIMKSDSSVLGWDLPRCVIILYVYIYIYPIYISNIYIYIQFIYIYIYPIYLYICIYLEPKRPLF